METVSQTLQYIVCSRCAGSGREPGSSRTCSQCRSLGLYAVLAERFLYWRQALSSFEITEERGLWGLKRFWYAALLIFGLVGAGLGFWSLQNYLDQSNPFSLESLLVTYKPAYLLFWLSLLGDLFLVYRVFEEGRVRREVLRRVVGTVPTNLPFDLDFNQVRGYPEESRVNVADSFIRETTVVIEDAKRLAGRQRHADITPLHLLRVLLKRADVRQVIGRLGVPLARLTQSTDKLIRRLPRAEKRGVEPVPSTEFRQLPLAAYREAYFGLGWNVRPTHLLIAIGGTESDAGELLASLGIDQSMLRNAVEWIAYQRELARHWRSYSHLARSKPSGIMNRSFTATATPFLDSLSRDLTQMAKAGTLELAVGRDHEVAKVFEALASGSPHVVLVGQPGVGKDAVVADIAHRMVSEEVPPQLKDHRLVSLSVPALVAGASAPGELEQRVLRLVNEVVRAGNIVLAVDDVQTLVGTGSGGGLDLSEVFAQVLGRNLFVLVATTTPDQWRRVIERSSIGPLLQKVDVPEPEDDTAIRILEAAASLVEFRSRVFFTYGAIDATATYSRRYIHDRAMPESGIRLLREVAAYVRASRPKRPTVTAEDVAAVVSAKTSIPLTAVTESEGEKLLHLEERLHARIIGQDEAVKKVAAALRRARTELRDAKRPIANLLFLGPTGVGKTELAKTVAEVYFGHEENMVRLDMSEYQTVATLSRLLGSEVGPGYLTEAIRAKPFTLLLLDELEKAHPDVLNVFLQVMDDGRLTDGQGRTIDFTSVILIATSNAGTLLIQEGLKRNASIELITAGLLEEELPKHFRPEFLNRFDGVIVFKPLTVKEVEQITWLLLKKLGVQLSAKGVKLEVTEAAAVDLARRGFDPKYGARPLRRVIQDEVQDALAKELLRGAIGRRDKVILDAGGKITVVKAEEVG